MDCRVEYDRRFVYSFEGTLVNFRSKVAVDEYDVRLGRGDLFKEIDGGSVEALEQI